MKLPRFLANIVRAGASPEIVTTRNFDDLASTLEPYAQGIEGHDERISKLSSQLQHLKTLTVTGPGTAGKLPIWLTASTLGDSPVSYSALDTGLLTIATNVNVPGSNLTVGLEIAGNTLNIASSARFAGGAYLIGATGNLAINVNKFTVDATTGNTVIGGTVSASNLSGTNTGDQTITLSGDVSGSGTGAITTAIGANKVTLAMQAQIATASFMGRNTALTGNQEVLSIATAKTMLNLTGTNSGDQTITLTGDVTGTGTGSFATAIGANKVTLGMQALLAANSIIGNNTGLSATPIAMTVAQSRTLLGIGTADSPTLTGLTLSGLTASLPVFTNGSDQLVSNAMTGTGPVVMGASPTGTGTWALPIVNISGLSTLGDSAHITASATLGVPTGIATDKGWLVLGASGSTQLQLATNQIQAMNGNTTSVMYLNYYGGRVVIGGVGNGNGLTIGQDVDPVGMLDVRSLSASNVIASFGCATSVAADEPGYIYISNINKLNSAYNVNSDGAALAINYSGYLNGITRTRDLYIADGKNNYFARFEGASKSLRLGDASAPLYTLDVGGTTRVTGIVIGENALGGSSSAFQAKSTSPSVAWDVTGQIADNKWWDMIGSGTQLSIRAVNDANNSALTMLQFSRSGISTGGVTAAVPLIISSGMSLTGRTSTTLPSAVANTVSVAGKSKIKITSAAVDFCPLTLGSATDGQDITIFNNSGLNLSVSNLQPSTTILPNTVVRAVYDSIDGNWWASNY